LITGLALVPGTNVMKVVEMLQQQHSTEDRSDFLSGPDACALRFQICDWNPLDQIFFFAVEELSSPIFKPTYCSWKVAQADWLSENNK